MKVADLAADAKKRMKSIGFPEMDSDALPSSFVLKVNICIGKWTTKLLALDKEMSNFPGEKMDKQPGLLYENILCSSS